MDPCLVFRVVPRRGGFLKGDGGGDDVTRRTEEATRLCCVHHVCDTMDAALVGC